MSTPPGNLPATPAIPLSDDLRAAYIDLYKKLENEYQSNPDATAREAVAPQRDNVSNILTKDNIYKFDQDTALFTALQQQISSTTDGLKTLQAQIKATASHFKTAADILGAITKVFGVLGVL
ncbi:MAG TPA: hypothetical protein VIM62_07535 [Acidobacteriaceae bacterium]